jgi:hypothetical protein
MRSDEDLCKVENLNRDQKLCICLVFLESIWWRRRKSWETEVRQTHCTVCCSWDLILEFCGKLRRTTETRKIIMHYWCTHHHAWDLNEALWKIDKREIRHMQHCCCSWNLMKMEIWGQRDQTHVVTFLRSHEDGNLITGIRHMHCCCSWDLVEF